MKKRVQKHTAKTKQQKQKMKKMTTKENKRNEPDQIMNVQSTINNPIITNEMK